MDFSKIKKVYIIGIEGAGTSALARMFKAAGKEVSGSDEGDHFYYDMLKDEEIKVFHQFDENNLPSDADLIVYSIAFKPETNPELKKALQGKAKVITYGEALSLPFNQKYGIAVCGSHGKGTTASWLSYVLQQAGLKPNAIIGAKVPQFNGNSLVGSSDYMIIEADEYGNKLQYYQPKMILLNNIDYDHPDFFPTVADYEKVFIEFIKKIPKKGFLIANFDDPIIRKIANVNCLGRVISYGISAEAEEQVEYKAYDLKALNGRQYFKVKWNGDELGDFAISLPGRHNIQNALAVIAALIELGVELLDIRKHLAEFQGTTRRMQKMGEYHGALIYDDYAHHPTEIQATLQGARQMFPEKKIKVVFHPHTFTRTKALLDDFAKSFQEADEVIVLDIYGSAREQQGGVHSTELVAKIKQHENQKEVKYIATLDECAEYLRGAAGQGDLVILMGAGDVFRVGERLIQK